jgi:hypothetical protein
MESIYLNRLRAWAKVLSGRGEKFLGVGGLGFGHLDGDGGNGIGSAAEHARRVFVDDNGVKARRFQPRVNKLRFGEIEAGEDGGKVHIQVLLEFKPGLLSVRHAGV